MCNPVWEKDFEKRTKASLQWLERSIQATDYQGSAAYYHLWKGWSAAYPETTGYIIETLFDYAAYFNENHYKDLAISCADWLCAIQNEDGSFPGGLGTSGQPVVFDTGQILFGLTRTFQETQDVKYQTSLKNAIHWLLNISESDGSWKQYSYIKDYMPAYYTRVVWAILQTNQILNISGINEKMQQALDYYLAKLTPQDSVKDWGFSPGEAAYTHTLAYVIRGLLESGYLLQNENLIQTSVKIANKLIELYQLDGKLAGQYDEDWQGDYNFICVTGNMQISLILSRLYRITNILIYRDYAIQIFQDTFSYQYLINYKGLYGGIPGSAPLWGKYQRFKFPNWAAKFYLDAYLQLYQIRNK